MPREIHPDEGRVFACPDCNQAPVYRRTGTNVSFDAEKEYRCNKCRATFDEPVERERISRTQQDVLAELGRGVEGSADV